MYMRYSSLVTLRSAGSRAIAVPSALEGVICYRLHIPCRATQQAFFLRRCPRSLGDMQGRRPPEGGRLRDCWKESPRLGGRRRFGGPAEDNATGMPMNESPRQLLVDP